MSHSLELGVIVANVMMVNQTRRKVWKGVSLDENMFEGRILSGASVLWLNNFISGPGLFLKCNNLADIEHLGRGNPRKHFVAKMCFIFPR